MPQPVDRYTWQHAVCGDHGPDNATARLILLTVSLHMNAQGVNAWPSQATIAKRARVTRRAVTKHLETAERLGWLARFGAGRNGQGWKLHGYEALVPDAVYEALPARPWETDPHWKRGERGSPPSVDKSKGGERAGSNVVNETLKGGERSIENVVNQVLTNLPSENLPSKSSLIQEGALARTARAKSDFERDRAEDEEASKAKKARTIGDLLAKGYSPTDIVKFTRSMNTTLDDVERYVQFDTKQQSRFQC